ncbi:MAG: chloride channel protein [Acidobacteriia bacterium]|nr:chloride channel protein [Terriglobia bacterium]
MANKQYSASKWFREFGKALDPGVIKSSLYALLVGLIGGLVAQGLLELIYLFTNLFFFGKWSFAINYPVGNHLGAWVILIPPIGGLLVGIMVHYWEPTLKGHGIPEAMEAVLVGKSKVRMRVGILKPLATAFAIGTGGPFGAEGPIIQTGAAFGSIFAQFTKMTPYQRRVLLAAGAAAGMAATFTAPFAGILVAIELLLFEFRARSFIPVALASCVATAVRVHFVGWAPLFPTPAFALVSMQELWLFGLLGVIMGLIAIAMIRVLFYLEELFDRFPIAPSKIWAPVAGAFLLGIIGYLYPQVFGTGYDTIRDMLNDRLSTGTLLGVSFAKFWGLVISLGSGTTGGVFAPSLIVGGGVGAVYAQVLHHFLPGMISDPALYALVAMAAVFGGIARAPFTSIVFLFELSRNPNALLPLVVCCVVSDGFVRLLSAESIMTGKLVKRGLIVRQDYSVPVLMRARIEQVMRKSFTVIKANDSVRTVIRDVSTEGTGIVPVIEGDGHLVGIVEAHDLLRGADTDSRVRDIARHDYVAAHPGDTVDDVTKEMLIHNAENVVVVEGNGIQKPIGVARAADILRLRRWVIEEEGVEVSGGLTPSAAPSVREASADPRVNHPT